jgi:hypothetical protein
LQGVEGVGLGAVFREEDLDQLLKLDDRPRPRFLQPCGQSPAAFGGDTEGAGDDRERLRKTVTARIRDSLRRLDDRHPALGAHLRASVHTGAVCVYAPAEPVSWDLGS